MKRKLVFLSALEHSKDVVETINEYFNKGYEIEKILEADCGYYVFLVFNNCGNYKYAIDLADYKSTLIEEINLKKEHDWNVTTTTDVLPN